ncbi:MAG: plasma-membrane proton-efflux P-type ATPase [Gammaproteobacteria bacterium]|nr:plasma-membrane proton-efflux P-type ATPase [Gammaproteobacteria bacterium]
MIKNILGLSNEEAHKRFLQYGLNEIKEQNQNQFLLLLNKFWSPVPWMLEVTIILQLFIGKFDEAIIIAALLVFNSLLSYFQEERANKALILLKQHLSIQARVLRHSQWQLIPIQELVPGDVVHLRMGDISPADIRILEGKILIDQSILTGESLPIESDIGTIAYSGAIINRGEATGEVIATGKNTYFGKTVELVQVAKSSSHIKNIIFTIVKYLVITDIFFVACVIVYALLTKLPFTEVLPYILILLVASIPVALPATFTLATAMGAMLLARRGVLVTHLTAIEEAATMDILCLDKTGTITQNQLKLAALKPFSSYTEDSLLFLAAIASDESTQDPIDKAILFAAQSRNLLTTMPERIKFIPFDPTYKRTEAVFNQKGKEIRVLKGAPDIIINLIPNTPNISEEIYKMAHMGHRILAVAVESEQRGILEFAGLIALYDPPRADSKSLIKSLKEFGLKICMVTGDGIVTAKAIANMVGMGKKVCSASIIQNEMKSDGLDCDVFAGMFPENKFQLVQILQKGNHIVGMTGDGVNDAPALKQAEVGIAVSNATDVAKAAASIVLTESGLNGLQFAIETSRRIYQRMLTYTLNKIIKSLEIIVFLSLGVMLTGNFIITPLLIVLLLFANDFMTMSIATDNVTYSHKPEHWHISNLMMIGAIIAALILLLSFSVFFYGKYVLHLTLPQLQTLIFVMLVFTGQGNIYLIRERKHFWNSLPGKWLILSSLLDISIVSTLAIRGILMTPLQPLLIVKLLAIVIVYLVAIDFLKIRIFSHFNVH